MDQPLPPVLRRSAPWRRLSLLSSRQRRWAGRRRSELSYPQSRINRTALPIFTGAEVCETSSWSPSKPQAEHMLPTWNYIAVHAHGRLNSSSISIACFRS
ncbi:FMN-binding negative transcriptional regulator [Bradyrhizobium sp. NBAIM20]|nr:FMN-binding negative transcriptional regulator [Bradyrhizobium sp. NBAIM20]MCA1459818.1 FMN-binding negative transcriptional regulator [Bradyrhizobium sp. NBAIM18]